MGEAGLDLVVEVDLSRGATVRARGELDGYTAAKLRSSVTEASLVSPGTIVLEMDEVSFMDSSGLAALVAVDRELRSRRGRLVVGHPSERVWKVLEITGAHRALDVQR